MNMAHDVHYTWYVFFMCIFLSSEAALIGIIQVSVCVLPSVFVCIYVHI